MAFICLLLYVVCKKIYPDMLEYSLNTAYQTKTNKVNNNERQDVNTHQVEISPTETHQADGMTTNIQEKQTADKIK